MASKEKSLRVSNIGFGILIMILAASIFYFSSEAVLMLIIVFAAVLLLLGMVRIINALSNDKLNNIGVIIKSISGVLIILGSLFVIIIVLGDLDFNIDMVGLIIIVYSILLMIIGLGRILIGSINGKYLTWYRIFLILIGIAIIVLSALVIFMDTLAISTIFIMFSISIFLSGFARFLLGLTGKEKLKK